MCIQQTIYVHILIFLWTQRHGKRMITGKAAEGTKVDVRVQLRTAPVHFSTVKGFLPRFPIIPHGMPRNNIYTCPKLHLYNYFMVVRLRNGKERGEKCEKRHRPTFSVLDLEIPLFSPLRKWRRFGASFAINTPTFRRIRLATTMSVSA